MAAGFEVLSYAWDAARCVALLRPVGHVRWRQALRAVYLGVLANQTLPVRAGEVVRAALLSRWASLPVEAVVPSVLLARLLDGVALAFATGLLGFRRPLPQPAVCGTWAFGILLLILLALALLLTRKLGRMRQWACPVSVPDLGMRVRRLVGLTAVGIYELRCPRQLAIAGSTTTLYLAFQACALWLAAKAYGLGLSIAAAWVVFLVVHLGTAIPGPPANVGSFQFFTVLALTFYGVEKSLAAGFSLFAYAVLTLPLSVTGLVSLTVNGWSLRKMAEHPASEGVARQ